MAKRKKKKTFSDVLTDCVPCKGDDFLEVFRKLIFLIAIFIFFVCLYLIVEYNVDNYKSRSEYDKVREGYEMMSDENPELVYDENNELVLQPLELTEFAKEQLAQNPDSIGFISIPDTVISYPVVQRKSDTKNEYYLTRTFYDTETKAGSIFMDYRNEFTDTAVSDNLIIYGHNMKDGSMFGELKFYKSKENFYSEHPIIYLDSNYQRFKYKVFGYFVEDASLNNTKRFDYNNYIDFGSEERFYEYVNSVKIRSLIINDVDIKYGDKLLTLSTCDSIENTRFVVVARLLRNGETDNEGVLNSYTNPNPLMPDIWYRKKGGSYDSSVEFIPYN